MRISTITHPAGGEVTAVSFDAPAQRKFEDAEAQELYFTGAVAEWAEAHREAASEWVAPRHVYTLSDDYGVHKVAWVYRAGTDLQTGESWHLHHAMCDCGLEAEAAGEPEKVFSCHSLNKVLDLRAQQVRQEHALDTMLGPFRQFNDETGNFELTQMGEEIAIRSLAYVLEIDRNAPAIWMANRISGRHDIYQLTQVLGETPSSVAVILGKLQQGRLIEFDGETVRLKDEDQQTTKGGTMVSYASYDEALASVGLSGQKDVSAASPEECSVESSARTNIE